MTEDYEEIRKELIEGLPPIVARKSVSKFLGGTVSPKSLANADSNGTGPECPLVFGCTIAYRREALVDWLLVRMRTKPYSRASRSTASRV